MSSFRSRILLSAALLAGVVNIASALTLQSADIHNNEMLKPAQVYHGSGCSGGNQSPQLSWSDTPAGTKSFAVTVYDQDARNGSGWWHWVVYDIPANVTQLAAGAGKADGLPKGAKHGRNDFGTKNFDGACPPPGSKPHHYIVTVYALKVPKLDVPTNAAPAMINHILNANKLATATITGLYAR